MSSNVTMEIDYGDGTSVEIVSGATGSFTPKIYSQPGVYWITVTAYNRVR